MVSFVLRTAALVCAFSPLGVCAQTSGEGRANSPAFEHQGLTGSLALGLVNSTVAGGESSSQRQGGFQLGYRVALGRVGAMTIAATPYVGLSMSHVRGIPYGSDERAVARLAAPGGQLSIRTGPVRPYLILERGSVSVERYAGGVLVNEKGKSTTTGVGIEIPRRNDCGAGLDLSVRFTNGDLTDVEMNGSTTVTAGASVRAVSFLVAWTGAFRGTHGAFCR